jgi:hypothetical protein
MECIILLIAANINKNYPNEFGIRFEVFAFLLIIFTTDLYFEYLIYVLPNSGGGSGCWGFSLDTWGNIVRNIFFQWISLIHPAIAASRLFP